LGIATTSLTNTAFHGTLFSLKFHKPFLAYYAEAMRATRFIDLAEWKARSLPDTVKL